MGPGEEGRYLPTPSTEARLFYTHPRTKENGVDKEDLTGHKVFFGVAFGLCAAVVPACYRHYNSFQRYC